MTKDQVVAEVRTTACRLVRQHGIPPDVACRMAARAVLRAAGLPVPSGLGTTTASSPAPSGSPSILADISAAGDDPSIAAARSAVSKWSWVIPVGGLLMSLKQKVSALRSPTSVAMVGSGGRR
jgi:hypothetical protein